MGLDILNEHCEGCDLVAGAAATAEASLIDTEKVFHSCGDSLQNGAFQQLVTYAQERYGSITCSTSKIQIDFTFLVPAHLGSPGQRADKRVCVCIMFKLVI